MGKKKSKEQKAKAPKWEIVDVSVNTNTNTTPSHLSAAIVGFDAIGAGDIAGFKLNGKLIRKKVTYKKSIKLQVGLGLFADGKCVRRIKKDDQWRIDVMNHKDGLVLNVIDQDMAYKFWLLDNPGRPMSEMPTS